MNAFFEHHKDSIQFGYRCFDRILLNGLIQPFQQPERVLGFFNAYREGKRVTKRVLSGIADQFQNLCRTDAKNGVLRFWNRRTVAMMTAGGTSSWIATSGTPSPTR